MAFAERLRTCGIDASAVTAHRITLHPADADDDYRTTADLLRTGHALVYERIQDEPLFGAEALIAAFIAGETTVRCLGLRFLVVRRPGLVPGDILYDPEIAHLLHNFIARAQSPTFYDAVEDLRGEALRDLVMRWPADASDLLHADDPRLIIEDDEP